MKRPNDMSPNGKTPGANRHRGSAFGRKRLASAAVVIVLAIYVFLQPRLNERLGWNLPGIGSGSRHFTSTEQVDRSDRSAAAASATQTQGSELGSGAMPGREYGSTASPVQGNPVQGNTANADASDAGRRSASMRAGGSNPDLAGNKAPPRIASDRDAANGETDHSTAAATLRYGILREVQPNRFLSPAGLQYTPGSAEGHRLEHLRRHTEDQPNRPGKHGVFDGGMEGMLTVIDEAYDRAKNDRRTTKQVDRDRTIYTVDMGDRVGYVGGRDGNRRGKPMARRVRLVLEGNRVITAYPL